MGNKKKQERIVLRAEVRGGKSVIVTIKPWDRAKVEAELQAMGYTRIIEVKQGDRQ